MHSSWVSKAKDVKTVSELNSNSNENDRISNKKDISILDRLDQSTSKIEPLLSKQQPKPIHSSYRLSSKPGSLPMWACLSSANLKLVEKSNSVTSPAKTASDSSFSSSESTRKRKLSDSNCNVAITSTQPPTDGLVDLTDSPQNVDSVHSVVNPYPDAKRSNIPTVWPIAMSSSSSKTKKETKKTKNAINSSSETSDKKVNELKILPKPSAPVYISSDNDDDEVSLLKKKISSKVKTNPFFISAAEKQRLKEEEINLKFYEQIQERKHQAINPKRTLSNGSSVESEDGNAFLSGVYFGRVREQLKDKREQRNQIESSGMVVASSIEKQEDVDMTMLKQYNIPLLEAYRSCAALLQKRLEKSQKEFLTKENFIYPPNVWSTNKSDGILVTIDDPTLVDTIEPGLLRPGYYGNSLRELFTKWLLVSNGNNKIIDMSLDDSSSMRDVPYMHKSDIKNSNAIASILAYLEVWAGKRCARKSKAHKKIHRKGRTSKWYDDDYSDQESDLNAVNPLILTGSCGSGKTSSALTCAEKVGFHVLEVSIPSLGNGTELLKRCSDAVQSHGLSLQSSAALDNLTSTAGGSNLILLDEADLCFEIEGERKISSAIVELVKSSKVPIIITSETPYLPWFESLPNREYVNFDRGFMPSPDTTRSLLMYLSDGDSRATDKSLMLAGTPTGEINGDNWYTWLAETKMDVAMFDTALMRMKRIVTALSAPASAPHPNQQKSVIYAPRINTIEPKILYKNSGDVLKIIGCNFLQTLDVGHQQILNIDVYSNSKLCEEVSVVSDTELWVRLPDTDCSVQILNLRLRITDSYFLFSNVYNNLENCWVRILPNILSIPGSCKVYRNSSAVDRKPSRQRGSLKKNSKPKSQTMVVDIDDMAENEVVSDSTSDFEEEAVSVKTKDLIKSSKKRVILDDDDDEVDISIKSDSVPAPLNESCIEVSADAPISSNSLEKPIKTPLPESSYSEQLTIARNSHAKRSSDPIYQDSFSVSISAKNDVDLSELSALTCISEYFDSLSDSEWMTHGIKDNMYDERCDVVELNQIGFMDAVNLTRSSYEVRALAEVVLTQRLERNSVSTHNTSGSFVKCFQDIEEQRLVRSTDLKETQDYSGLKCEEKECIYIDDACEEPLSCDDSDIEAVFSDGEGVCQPQINPQERRSNDCVGRHVGGTANLRKSKNCVFSSFNFLTYQHDKEAVTRQILAACHQSASVSTLPSGSLGSRAMDNHLRASSIHPHLTLEVIPLLGHMLVHESNAYELDALAPDCTGNVGRSRRSSKLLQKQKYSHTSRASGLTTTQLDSLKHLAFFGQSPLCCS